MRRPFSALCLAAAALLAGCPPDDEPTCTVDHQKAAVLDLVRDWYLYPELLPAQVDLADYASAADLLDALTQGARDTGKDRGWSYLTTVSAQQSFFVEGTSVGFGLGLLVRADPLGGERLFVSTVYEGSAAADAGFLRGDEVVAIGEPPGPLTPVADLLAADALGAALGPPVANVVRTLEVIPRGGATAVQRTMSKRTFALDPVPLRALIPRDGLPDAGYVALRTFISPAEADLTLAFQEFQAAGVTDVIVDLRYNGGGLVSTAEHLANLLADGLAGGTMFVMRNNPGHAAGDASFPFVPVAASVAPARIAFITTGASASASELVPNVLEAWMHDGVALVGEKTYGKPVGQRGFLLAGCDTLAYLVSFKLVNAEGDGDYFGGLPDAPPDVPPRFSGCLVPAADDLARDIGDPLEASTAAALGWLTGGCPPPAPAALSVAAPDAYPESPAPDEAQRHVRGLF